MRKGSSKGKNKGGMPPPLGGQLDTNLKPLGATDSLNVLNLPGGQLDLGTGQVSVTNPDQQAIESGANMKEYQAMMGMPSKDPFGAEDPVGAVLDPEWKDYLQPGAIPFDQVSAFAPIPSSNFDSRSVFETGIRQMYGAAPGDTLEQLSAKIQGRAKAVETLSPIVSNMTPDETRKIVQEHYDAQMGNTLPTHGISTQERAYFERLFDVGPQRKFATLADVPRDQLNFALGYGVMGLLGGRGFRPAADAVNSQVGNLQSIYDRQFQNENAQFESRQKVNLELAKRSGEISDQNFQQEGYLAKDIRDGINAINKEVAVLDRQTQIEAQKFLNSYARDIFEYVQKGDSDRFAPVLALARQVSPKLADALAGMGGLAKTSGEALTDAKAGSAVALTERTKQIIQQSNALFPLTKGKLEADIELAGNRAEYVAEQVKLMAEKVKSYPREVAAKILLDTARAESLKVRAEAALKNANKPNSGFTSAELSLLRTVGTLSGSAADNYWQQEVEARREIEKHTNDLKEVATGRTVMTGAAFKKTFDEREKKAKEGLDAAQKRLEIVQKAQRDSQDQLDRVGRILSEKGGVGPSVGSPK